MDRMKQRRRALAWMGAVAIAPLAVTPAIGADERPPTPPMTEGPFYPRSFPRDTDADLTRVEGHGSRSMGTVLALSGRIVDRRGAPRAGTRIEIWQCDATGQYHHVGEPGGDPDFQGFGAINTDADGRYAFTTIKPVPYPGRTPHIHFTIVEKGRRTLTSQMFLEGEPGNDRDFLYRSAGRAAKLLTLKLESAGDGLRGGLDIVLA